MSNWQYANAVPTIKWRSASTLPRELSLQKIKDKYYISSTPAREVAVLKGDKIDIHGNKAKLDGGAMLHLATGKLNDFSIVLSNDSSQRTIIGYDKAKNQYYIDRTASGKTSFEKGFASRTVAPRVAVTDSADITVVIDVASVELFADKGTTVMTGIFFPDEDYDEITIVPEDKSALKTIELTAMKPM
jgi:fructan beta-fructosidase